MTNIIHFVASVQGLVRFFCSFLYCLCNVYCIWRSHWGSLLKMLLGYLGCDSCSLRTTLAKTVRKSTYIRNYCAASYTRVVHISHAARRSYYDANCSTMSSHVKSNNWNCLESSTNWVVSTPSKWRVLTSQSQLIRIALLTLFVASCRCCYNRRIYF